MTKKERKLLEEAIGPSVIPTFTFGDSKFVRLEFVVSLIKTVKEVLKNGKR